MMRTTLAAAAALCVTAAGAMAAPVTPVAPMFGDVQTATATPVTFGGMGIPTDRSAFGTFTAMNGDQLILGLAAHQRFSNPALADDGAGTYTAGAGANDGTPGSMVGTIGATWNFAFFVEVIDNGGGSAMGDFGTSLLYDLDPGAGTDDADHGTIALGALGAAGMLNPIEGSQNANFGFLTVPAPGLTPPAFAPFDPNAPGEYTFALRSTLGEVAIQVNVVSASEPGALALAGAGLAVLGATRLRRHG